MDDLLKTKVDLLAGLCDEGALERIARELEPMHPAEVAHVMDHLSAENKRTVFAALDAAAASEVIVELSDYSREQILDNIQTQRVADIVDDLPSDEATDIIADLPDEQAAEVLERIDAEDSQEVRTLLQYEEDSAGGIMQLELVSVRSQQSVTEVIEAIRARRDEVENLVNVYVVDRFEQLKGILPLNKLILAQPDELVENIMEPCPLVISADEDQEAVAQKFRRYDMMSAPVVDDQNRLLGRITIDDVVDVLSEEADEDFMRLAGSSEVEIIYSEQIFRISRLRLPWLLSNLLGGLVSGWLLWLFRVTLTDAIFLISFVPVIMAMGGNVGVQSTTIMVRGIAVGWVAPGTMARVLLREFKVALLMGAACGLVAGGAGFFWHGNWALGLVVGLSMMGAMTVAATLGTLAPAFFQSIKVDPAVSSGPFVTTANDILAILIYFAFATAFYRYLVT